MKEVQAHLLETVFLSFYLMTAVEIMVTFVVFVCLFKCGGALDCRCAGVAEYVPETATWEFEAGVL